MTSLGGSSAVMAISWRAEGPQGGPFSPAKGSVRIVNSTAGPVTWSLSNAAPWLQATPSSGSLAAGAIGGVKLQLNSSVCNALAPGLYVTQAVDNFGTVLATASLNVLPASSDLTVSPAENFRVSGPEGGPFDPLAKSYAATNTGSSALSWSLDFDAPWAFVKGPTSGVLNSGATLGWIPQVDPIQVFQLPAGTHLANARLRNAQNGVVLAQRQIEVTVAPKGNGGWTPLSPSADSIQVYVSSSTGQDSNDGLSPAKPKRSISEARKLLRWGFPDWILLKRGDVWDYSFDRWATSGRSASEPQVLTSYGPGTTRPLIRTGDKVGILSLDKGPTPPWAVSIDHVAIVGIHFQANGYDGWNGSPAGFRLLFPVQDWLVEDCMVQGYYNAFILQAGANKTHDGIRLRRNVVIDSDCKNAALNPQAIYAAYCNNILIEENLIDKIGQSAPTIFRHGIYVDVEGNSNFVIRGNIICQPGSHGVQLRPGGVVEGNLFARNPIAIEMGSYESDHPSSIFRRNVVLDGIDTSPTIGRGWGVMFDNAGTSLVEDNVVANMTAAKDGRPMEVNILNQSTCYGITFRKNVVYGWPGKGINLQYKASSNLGMVIEQNVLRSKNLGVVVGLDDDNTPAQVTSWGNSFYSNAAPNNWFKIGSSGPLQNFQAYLNAVNDTSSTIVSKADDGFPSPNDRTLADYNAFLGKARNHDAFIAEVRKQSRDTWRPEYSAAAVNAWIRAGFGR